MSEQIYKGMAKKEGTLFKKYIKEHNRRKGTLVKMSELKSLLIKEKQ